MADVLRRDVALAIPFFLEGQGTQDAIRQAAHFLDAIRQPSPNLRRHEIQYGDAVRPRAPSQPPVKAGIIDEYQGVGALFLKKAIGHAEDAPEARHIGNHRCQADDGEIAEWIEQATAGRRHAFAAEAVYLCARLAPTESVNEVGTV